MKTREISKEELSQYNFVCEGYKAVNYDNGTKQSFSYAPKGASLIGCVYAVDGEISECKWGLHFSKDPAYVFKFYEPLGYNKYFKIRAYDKVVDSADGFKSITNVIEFIEEYDLMQFIEIIKRFDRKPGVSYSNGVRSSNGVSYSTGVSGSNAVNDSTGVSYSNGVRSSNGVSYSTGVRSSNAVSCVYAIRECEAVKNGIFCYKIEGRKNVIFNKKCTEERFNEVYRKLKSFNWTPSFENWYDIKGDKEWWAFCFPELKEVSNKEAWSKMPSEMREYIESLPEFDKKIFKKITE